jgi:hypothetical protein|tara:strand:+ start:401 stop:1375 length:975 start_codon:yes stop_codon:yes gene_type:complete
MSEIRVNKLIDEAGTGSVELTEGATLPSGKTLSGAGSINIDGNITTGGVLTYEDVASVDSVGIVTARQGVHFGTSTEGTLVVGDAVGVGIGTDDPDFVADIRDQNTKVAQFVTRVSNANGALVRIRKDDTGALTTNDSIGTLQFSGSNNTDVAIYEFASLETKVITGTPGSEDGQLDIKTTTAGAPTTKLSIDDTTCTFTAGLVEKFEKAGTTLGSQPNNPIGDGNVILFTGNESGTNTINFTGVHAKLADGEACSFTAIISPNGSGYINVVQVDGQAITPVWSGGSAPSAGGGSGRDVYTFTILKTGSGVSDYTILGAVTNYA